MQITRRSRLTGHLHTREIPVTGAQLDDLDTGTRPIQAVLPHLSDDDREFLITGITPAEWEAFLGPGDGPR